MNETAWIFTSILAYGVGYGIAHFVKKFGELASKWGFFSIFLFPIIIVYLMFGAAMLADLRSIFISFIFASGFIFRMVKQG